MNTIIPITIILLVFIIISCKPKQTVYISEDKSRVTKDEYKQAQKFTDDFYKWSSKLSDYGGKIKDIIFKVQKGEPTDPNKVPKLIKEAEEVCSAKIIELENTSLPSFKEIHNYREVVLQFLKEDREVFKEYLVWLKIAQDSSLTLEQKQQKTLKLLLEGDKKHHERAKTIQDAELALQRLKGKI